MPSEQTASTQPQDNSAVGSLDEALTRWGEEKFKIMSRGRYGEELQWLEAALFDQNKQWLTREGSGAGVKLKQIPQDTKKPIPMPVSNYFSKTINANANSLGAEIPEMVANPADSSNPNRRAAQAAERALKHINRSSDMYIINPQLAKHTVIFGIGVTKDVVDTSAISGMDQIPQIEANEDESGAMVPSAGNVASFPKGEIVCEIPSIFEIYVDRRTSNPNMSKTVLHRRRVGKAKVMDMYGDVAKDLRAEERTETAEIYAETIRSMVNFGTTGAAGGEDEVTLNEIWTEWTEIPEYLEDQIEAEWQGQQSEAYPQMSKLEAAMQYGLYFIWAQKHVLAKAENPWDGEKCFTFYIWQLDVANPYTKGLAPDVIPLQKQLNRLDSLTLKALMCNGVGKWVVPTTQINITRITGDPDDTVYWDPQGDGKVAPQYYPASPYSSAIAEKRESILNDFRELGYTQGVEDGGAPPGGVDSFRGIAFLGAKAEEGRKTQRFLTEQGHEMHAKKLIIMAKRVWDEPRQVKIAGFNGKFGMAELMGSDLEGDYSIEVVPDSSKPKTQQEKISAMQMLLMGGLIDPADPAVRDYITDSLGMNEIDLVDHYQYEKSERDLEKLKQGQQPIESPFENWAIALRTFATYTLTEDFEELSPQIQMGIILYAQYVSDKLTAVKQTQAGGGSASAGAQLATALYGMGGQGAPGGNPMSATPGQSNIQQVQQQSLKEGNSVAQQVTPGR